MQKTLSYQLGEETFNSFLTAPPMGAEEKRAAVLVLPTWMGCDSFAKEKAQELTAFGYIGCAVDLYGKGKIASGAEEAGNFMLPLFQNRAVLQNRLLAALEALKEEIGVDRERVAVIGFCFGGLAAIELLRTGASIKGAVSFHGVLGTNLHGIQSETVPIAPDIAGSLLVLHGYQDPLVTPADLLNLEQEMSQAQVDWQIQIYGSAGHSFMNPDADQKNSGYYFDSKTSKRAWAAMRYFLSELFSKTSR